MYVYQCMNAHTSICVCVCVYMRMCVCTFEVVQTGVRACCEVCEGDAGSVLIPDDSPD